MKQKIINILEDENNQDNYDELILILEPWEDVKDALFSILLDNARMNLWYDVCTVIYSSVSRKDYPVNYTIAVLHSCLEESDELDENLVWSITKDLKRIDYLAEYDPYQDEAVFSEMKKTVR